MSSSNITLAGPSGAAAGCDAAEAPLRGPGVSGDVSGLIEIPGVNDLTEIPFVHEDGSVGVGPVRVVAALVALDSPEAHRALSDGELVELVAASARLESYAAAVQRRAAAALGRRGSLKDKLVAVRVDNETRAAGRDVTTPARVRSFRVSESASDELSARLGISRPAAARLVAEGRAMESHACLVGEALTNGDISALKARIVTDALHDQPLETCLAVSEEVLPAAPGLQPAELTRRVQRLVIEANPGQSAERARRARASRTLSAIQPLPDGLARISITSGRLDVAAFRTAADLAAKAAKSAGDERTMDQLRADAATTFALTALHHGELPPLEPLPGMTPVAPVASVVIHDPEPPFSGTAIDTGTPPVAGEGTANLDPGTPPAAPGTPPAAGEGTANLLVSPPEWHALRAATGTTRFDPRRARTLVVDEGLVAAAHDAALPSGSAQSWTDDLDDVADEVDALHCAAAIMLESYATQQALAAVGLVELGPAGAGCGRRREPPPPPDPPISESGSPGRKPSHRPGEGVPELVGAGPLDHLLARELALKPPGWLGVVVLTDGEASAPLGRENGYVPSARLRRGAVAAHPTCVGPTCHVPSRECQLDHVVPWPMGRTEGANLRPLCQRCHLLKTHGGHSYEVDTSTSVVTWTTATGHRYRRTPSGVTTHLPRARLT